jgi:hypothetical protein
MRGPEAALDQVATHARQVNERLIDGINLLRGPQTSGQAHPRSLRSSERKVRQTVPSTIGLHQMPES